MLHVLVVVAGVGEVDFPDRVIYFGIIAEVGQISQGRVRLRAGIWRKLASPGETMEARIRRRYAQHPEEREWLREQNPDIDFEGAS